MKSKLLKEAGQAMKIQQNQVLSAEDQMIQMKDALNKLNSLNDSNLDELDRLIAKAELMCNEQGMDINNLDYEDIDLRDFETYLESDGNVENSIRIEKTDKVYYQDNWDEYMKSINKYADNHSIDLVGDPFATLLSASQHKNLMDNIKNDYYSKKPEMDKYDYIIAAACGVFAGIIDSLFVGDPKNSILGDWTKDSTDKAIIKIAELKGWNKKSESPGIANAIAFLEGKYKVNYDQATGKAAGELLNMSAKNHHFKSLSHAPDIVGLLFSILDQFSGTSHFLDNGRLIVFDTGKSQLVGGNLIAKVFAGFSNWLGHCLSDIAGSSVNRRNNEELHGSGLSIPFFELFQSIGVGEIGEDKLTIADTAVKIFESGYDARFGVAMSIPVIINDLLVRLCWILKRHFYHKESLKKCIPIVLLREIKDEESNAIILRRMLLASYGSMCLVDFADAAIRSGGVNNIGFLLRLNFKAWKKLAVNLAISGVMELRLNYNSTHLNVKKLDKDLKEEWNRLYLETL